MLIETCGSEGNERRFYIGWVSIQVKSSRLMRTSPCPTCPVPACFFIFASCDHTPARTSSTTIPSHFLSLCGIPLLRGGVSSSACFRRLCAHLHTLGSTTLVWFISSSDQPSMCGRLWHYHVHRGKLVLLSIDKTEPGKQTVTHAFSRSRPGPA